MFDPAGLPVMLNQSRWKKEDQDRGAGENRQDIAGQGGKIQADRKTGKTGQAGSEIMGRAQAKAGGYRQDRKA